MTAASVFDFRFKPENSEEGGELAAAIGGDMPATAGYIRHDVIRDLADSAHVVVITQWHEQAQGEAVLSEYVHNEKVNRATELIGSAPSGFLGRVD